jgi:hypothetical protein
MILTTTPGRWAALALAGCLALGAAACGDDSDGDSASGGSDDFCARMLSLEERVESGGTPTPDEMADMMEALAELEPPAELADEWETISEAASFVDNPEDADPANATAYQEAFEAVDDYMQNECGQ